MLNGLQYKHDFYMYWEIKNLCHLLYCAIWFTAVAWNGASNVSEVCLLVSAVSGMILTMGLAVSPTTAFAT